MSTETRCDKCAELTDPSLLWKFLSEPSGSLQQEGYGKEHSDICHACKEKWFDSHVYATGRIK